jgi:DNA-directed RNA polymerase specialized sigma24 family protein
MPRPKRPKITKALVDRVVNGDRKALCDFVKLVEHAIRWKIASVLLPARPTRREDTRDVIQITLMAMVIDGYKLIKAWDPSRRPFEVYSRLIAKQKAIEFLRQHKDEGLDGIDAREPKATRDCSPEEQVAAKELGQKALEQLKLEQSPLGCQLVELLIIEKRTTEDVRDLMGMAANTVDQWRSRLLSQLKKILASLGGD